MESLKEVTYKEAGLNKEKMYTLLFEACAKSKTGLTTKEMYEIVNKELSKQGEKLSKQGESSLRVLINKYAVEEGFIFPWDDNNSVWRLTPKGIELINNQDRQKEIVFNELTQETEEVCLDSVKGAVFELYNLELLKIIYPFYTWFHQGNDKKNERGLDLIAEKIGQINDEYKTIGVQIKNHDKNNTPTDEEWLKFLSGCFVRHIDKSIFITSGKLRSKQRREAGEGKIMVIEGIEELNRLAKVYNYKSYDDYLKDDYLKEAGNDDYEKNT